MERPVRQTKANTINVTPFVTSPNYGTSEKKNNKKKSINERKYFLRDKAEWKIFCLHRLFFQFDWKLSLPADATSSLSSQQGRLGLIGLTLT